MADRIRGTVYWADLGQRIGRKPYVVVSNNARNRRLDDVLAVRVTTSVKPNLASIVTLGHEDPLVGRVLCDDIVQIYQDEFREPLGALTPATMQQVEAALRYALAL